MFSFFKSKGAVKSVTVVHEDVGASLERQASFPTLRSSGGFNKAPKELALSGAPPQATLLDQPIPGETTTAYVVERSTGYAPLGFLNVRTGGKLSIEVWELGSGDKPLFARKRAVSLDPKQDSWVSFLLTGVASLPGDRFLLSVSYYDPHVIQGLFLYDSTSDSYTKISNIKPYADNREQFFDAQPVAPGAVIVHYFSNTIRLAPEVYYNTPSHLRLFSSRYPQGIDLVQLAAADGSVRRWAVVDKTLWIDALDYRERHKPKELVWSLDLGNVLKR